MDIFNTIEQAENDIDKVKPNVKNANEFYLGFEGYKVSDPQFDTDKQHDDLYKYIKPEIAEKKGLFIKARTNRLYKLLTKPAITEYRLDEADKVKRKNQRRLEKVERLIKKGVDPSLFTYKMYKDIIDNITVEEMKVLFRGGFVKLWDAIQNSSRYKERLRNDIYFCVENVNDSKILRYIPENILEGIINTRKNLQITKETTNFIIYRICEWYDEQPLKNLDLLVKYGQVGLEESEIKRLGEFIMRDPANQQLAPTLTKLCQHLDSVPVNDVYAKYATQKKLADNKKTKTSKDEAKEVINKLFSDAQNSIDQ